MQVHDVEFCAGGVDQIVTETLPALQEARLSLLTLVAFITSFPS
jgi:hypothetical protein